MAQISKKQRAWLIQKSRQKRIQTGGTPVSYALFCLNTLPEQPDAKYIWLDGGIWNDGYFWID